MKYPRWNFEISVQIYENNYTEFSYFLKIRVKPLC